MRRICQCERNLSSESEEGGVLGKKQDVAIIEIFKAGAPGRWNEDDGGGASAHTALEPKMLGIERIC